MNWWGEGQLPNGDTTQDFSVYKKEWNDSGYDVIDKRLLLKAIHKTYENSFLSSKNIIKIEKDLDERDHLVFFPDSKEAKQTASRLAASNPLPYEDIIPQQELNKKYLLKLIFLIVKKNQLKE